MRRHAFLIFLLFLIPLVAWGGFNAPLVSWPFSMEGGVLKVDPAVTVEAESMRVASFTLTEVNITFARQTFVTPIATNTAVFPSLAFADEDALLVYVNGCLQDPDTDFDVAGSTTLTLSDSVPAGTKIHCVKLN